MNRRVDELTLAAEAGGRRLAARLDEIRAAKDLNRRSVVAAQRDINRLDRIGAMPGPTEYWHRWAVPRADEFTAASLAVVLDEGQQLARSLDEFLAAVAGLRQSNRPRSWPVGNGFVEEPALAAVDRLRRAVPHPAPIYELGQWWQQRLRRTALRRAMPHLLTPGCDPERVIGRAELALLDSPPWCHSDRLLSAFELAHSEIRQRTDLMADTLDARLLRAIATAPPPPAAVGPIPVAGSAVTPTIELP